MKVTNSTNVSGDQLCHGQRLRGLPRGRRCGFPDARPDADHVARDGGEPVPKSCGSGAPGGSVSPRKSSRWPLTTCGWSCCIQWPQSGMYSTSNGPAMSGSIPTDSYFPSETSCSPQISSVGGGDPGPVLELLAQALDRPVAVHEEEVRLVAHSGAPDRGGDEARRRTRRPSARGNTFLPAKRCFDRGANSASKRRS